MTFQTIQDVPAKVRDVNSPAHYGDDHTCKLQELNSSKREETDRMSDCILDGD